MNRGTICPPEHDHRSTCYRNHKCKCGKCKEYSRLVSRESALRKAFEPIEGWPNISPPMSWMDDAACAEIGGEIFFPDSQENPRRAKEFCAGCPVVDTCLEYALENGEMYGVWGGKSAIERKRILSKRRRSVASGTDSSRQEDVS